MKNCWRRRSQIVNERRALVRVSVIAQTDVLMSVEYVQNVHITRCDRHQQWTMSKILGLGCKCTPSFRL